MAKELSTAGFSVVVLEQGAYEGTIQAGRAPGDADSDLASRYGGVIDIGIDRYNDSGRNCRNSQFAPEPG